MLDYKLMEFEYIYKFLFLFLFFKLSLFGLWKIRATKEILYGLDMVICLKEAVKLIL